MSWCPTDYLSNSVPSLMSDWVPRKCKAAARSLLPPRLGVLPLRQVSHFGPHRALCIPETESQREGFRKSAWD